MELLAVSQEVTNDRMYQMLLKDSGLKTEQEQKEERSKIIDKKLDFASHHGSDSEDDTKSVQEEIKRMV